jgi:hypothetical protein
MSFRETAAHFRETCFNSPPERAMSRAAKLSFLSWVALTVPLAAYAHVDKVTGQDYRDFQRNDGMGSCCDWQDCRPAFEPFMDKDGEKIRDRANNTFAFDPGKVVKRPSDDGNWHVCANATRLYCIIAPPQAGREPDPAGDVFGWLFSIQPAAQSFVPTDAERARQRADAPICRAPRL